MSTSAGAGAFVGGEPPLSRLWNGIAFASNAAAICQQISEWPPLGNALELLKT